MRRILIPVTLAALFASASFAQDTAPAPEQPANPPIDLDEPAQPETAAPEAAEQPADDADAGQLEALVISVSGRGGRWLAPGADSWTPIAVDDVLPAGSRIDTGLRGEVGLRVGKNATLLISSASSVELARIAETDGRLVTRALLTKGAADFKVDHVGLENDFVVITPSSTMAVKGTGFRVIHGPMRGTEIEGVRANRVNAIEVGYFEVRTQIRMSGRSMSNSSTPSPAMAALGNTIAPPPGASPANNDAANAPGSSQTQTVQNTQSVNVNNAAFSALIAGFGANGIGGVPAVNPQPNPGQSGSAGSPMPGNPMPGHPMPGGGM